VQQSHIVSHVFNLHIAITLWHLEQMGQYISLHLLACQQSMHVLSFFLGRRRRDRPKIALQAGGRADDGLDQFFPLEISRCADHWISPVLPVICNVATKSKIICFVVANCSL
jgi:hypothetical protein